jgi:hypothetical protein
MYSVDRPLCYFTLYRKISQSLISLKNVLHLTRPHLHRAVGVGSSGTMFIPCFVEIAGSVVEARLARYSHKEEEWLKKELYSNATTVFLDIIHRPVFI